MRTTLRCLTLVAAVAPLATVADSPASIQATPARRSAAHDRLARSLFSSAIPDPSPSAAADAHTPAAAPAAGVSHDAYEGAHEKPEAKPPVAALEAPVATGDSGEDSEEVDIGVVISEVDVGPGGQGAAAAGDRCNGTVLDPAIYDGILGTYAEALRQMVAVACSEEWRGMPGDLVGLIAPWSITWSQITGAADNPCSATLTPPGSTATGCAWSAASAYAAAFALSEVHADTAAAAFAEHCAPRCAAAAAGGWEFAGPDTTLLVITDTYAAASEAACAAGQTSGRAAEWSLCYSSIIGDKLTQALVRSLLGAECFAAPQAGVVQSGLEALAAAGGLCFAARG